MHPEYRARRGESAESPARTRDLGKDLLLLGWEFLEEGNCCVKSPVIAFIHLAMTDERGAEDGDVVTRDDVFHFLNFGPTTLILDHVLLLLYQGPLPRTCL